MSDRPPYQRAMLTALDISAETSGRFNDQVDCRALQHRANSDLVGAITTSLRARQRRARLRGEAWPYRITLGQLAEARSISPEEAAEAILGWGYWIYFERNPCAPVADWRVDEEGE